MHSQWNQDQTIIITLRSQYSNVHSFYMLHKLQSPVKYVVNLLSDIRSKAKKFAINSVQDGFEKVAFSWIFTVEQLQ